MTFKSRLTVQFVIAGIVLYCALVASVYFGAVVGAVLIAWMASPILFYWYALRYENASMQHGGRGTSAAQVFTSVFSLKTGAWSFVIGDTIILPAALGIAAHKWHNSTARMDNFPFGLFIICAIVGLIAGLLFHFKMDKPAYIQAGYEASLRSPTKLFHDLVTYPVLFGGLLFATMPMIISASAWGWHLIAILGLILVWLTLGALYDGNKRQQSGSMIPWGHSKFNLQKGVCIP